MVRLSEVSVRQHYSSLQFLNYFLGQAKFIGAHNSMPYTQGIYYNFWLASKSTISYGIVQEIKLFEELPKNNYF